MKRGVTLLAALLGAIPLCAASAVIDASWVEIEPGFHTTPARDGACPAALRPVHRLYNNRWTQGDSGHRYVTAASLIAPMQARGWIHEGVAFCAKP